MPPPDDRTLGELLRGLDRLERDLARMGTTLGADIDKHQERHVSVDAFEVLRDDVQDVRVVMNRLLLAVIGEVVIVAGIVVAALIIKGLG